MAARPRSSRTSRAASGRRGSRCSGHGSSAGVRHKVVDFDRWKAVFDGHAEAQRAAGLTVTHVMRNVADPGEVVLLFEVEDVARARPSPGSSGVMAIIALWPPGGSWGRISTEHA